MENNINLIKELIHNTQLLYFKDGNLYRYIKHSQMIIKKIFGDKSDYLKEFDKISFESVTFPEREINYLNAEYFETAKKYAINLFEVMIADLKMNKSIKTTGEQEEEEEEEDNLEKVIIQNVGSRSLNIKNEIKDTYDNNKIFIVHGHNLAMKQEVARTLEKLNLEPIILHEQPDGGKTIIEKFTDNSNVGFAIVLLSADDVAHPKNSPNDTKKRARQNVILELGYFLGKLGREKVLSLYEENSNLEIPTDYLGVLFTPYDNHGSWKTKLAKELRHAGYKIDAEAIVNL